MSLQGFSEGKSQEEILMKARDTARNYYGNSCVKVTLSNERATSLMFTADWVAEVKHRSNQASYGFSTCISCGKRL